MLRKQLRDGAMPTIATCVFSRFLTQWLRSSVVPVLICLIPGRPFSEWLVN